MKIIFAILSIFVLSTFISLAHGEETFAEAEKLIESKISCDGLTEEQFEIIGDYYMEQMHPGEAHEQMDGMMGGEGSESLKQMHIRMAKSFYCGEHDVMSSGMMNMMVGGKTGIMDCASKHGIGGKKMGYGMIGSTGNFWYGLLGLVYFAVIAFIFSLIFWLTHNFIVKDKKRKR